ncbi:MAG: tetratricopeptide repeat protein [Bacteroidota bacterium]
MRSLFILFFLLTVGVLLAQPAQKLIRSGNNAYKEMHFKDAEIDYRKALVKSPNSPKATFNLGNSLYKQQNFSEATAQYQKLAQSESKEASKASVYYNMGNSLLEGKKYKESIDAYKMALRQNPKDEDTRYNLSYAMTKLMQQKKQEQNKKQQQQQQQQQKQQQQQQPKPNMSKQDANRMLNAVNNNEKRTLDKTKNKQQASSQNQSEKDW